MVRGEPLELRDLRAAEPARAVRRRAEEHERGPALRDRVRDRPLVEFRIGDLATGVGHRVDRTRADLRVHREGLGRERGHAWRGDPRLGVDKELRCELSGDAVDLDRERRPPDARFVERHVLRLVDPVGPRDHRGDVARGVRSRDGDVARGGRGAGRRLRAAVRPEVGEGEIHGALGDDADPVRVAREDTHLDPLGRPGVVPGARHRDFVGRVQASVRVLGLVRAGDERGREDQHHERETAPDHPLPPSHGPEEPSGSAPSRRSRNRRRSSWRP